MRVFDDIETYPKGLLHIADELHVETFTTNEAYVLKSADTVLATCPSPEDADRLKEIIRSLAWVMSRPGK